MPSRGQRPAGRGNEAEGARTRRDNGERCADGVLGCGSTEIFSDAIFISYAHVDNQPFPGQTAGWVTTLVEHLKNLLDRRFGRRDRYSLWMDPRLTGNEPFTGTIEAALRGAGVIVSILSPAYLESEWCRRELATFLGVAAGRPRPASRHSSSRDRAARGPARRASRGARLPRMVPREPARPVPAHAGDVPARS